MSALILILQKNMVSTATDTLSCFKPSPNDTQLKPRSYTTKAFLLPQLKSIMAFTGVAQLAFYWYRYIIENFIGKDIDSLLNINTDPLKSYMNENELKSILTGSLYFAGYSEQDKKFKGHKIQCFEEGELKQTELDYNIYIKPNHEGIEPLMNKILQENPGLNYDTFSIKMIKKLREIDEDLPVDQQVGIGGEIQFTQAYNENNSFKCGVHMIYRFDDYVSKGDEMLRNAFI
jgi:hypothetical protein